MLDDLTRAGLTRDQYRLCERCEVYLDRGLGNGADLDKLELLWKEKGQKP
jgi:hypothetical protein